LNHAGQPQEKMSWLFGYRSQVPQDFSHFVPPSTAGGDGAGGSGSPPKINNSQAKSLPMEAYRFDSSALERAAGAAKELERSSTKYFLFVVYPYK